MISGTYFERKYNLQRKREDREDPELAGSFRKGREEGRNEGKEEGRRAGRAQAVAVIGALIEGWEERRAEAIADGKPFDDAIPRMTAKPNHTSNARRSHVPSLRTNNIFAKNREGKRGLGLGLVYPSAEAVELVGMLGGFDYVNLDGEHGLFSPESIDAMVRVADGYGLTVTARVPNLASSTINQFMDRGVIGILGPHVDTAEQAKQLVDACRFVPEGERSWGGGRGTFYNDSGLIDQPGLRRTEYMELANKETLVMAQLETATAFSNLDAILAVEGIDAFAWGSNDLAQSMGLPGQPDHPDVKAAEASVAERIHAAGRKMSYDISSAVGLPEIILSGARAYLAANA